MHVHTHTRTYMCIQMYMYICILAGGIFVILWEGVLFVVDCTVIFNGFGACCGRLYLVTIRYSEMTGP